MSYESEVEEATLEWLHDLGYAILHGPDILPGELNEERSSEKEVVLVKRLKRSLERINHHLPSKSKEIAIDYAVKKLIRTQTQNLIFNNHIFHKMLVNGIDVEIKVDDKIKYEKVWLVDFENENENNNDWLAVNQFTVIENDKRRPDIVIFINGIPISVIELKNPSDEDATIKSAYNQIQTYKIDIPSLFNTNEIIIVSDGIKAKVGSLTADWKRFMPWRSIESNQESKPILELKVATEGVFEKKTLLDLIRNCIVFETEDKTLVKKLAGYHQYHAVKEGVEQTLRASSPQGNKQIGVIFHAPGGGKSLSMAFIAGKLIRHPGMNNPTIVVITDRNDLDYNLFDSFAKESEILMQEPKQAKDSKHLRKLLSVASGGVIFTTIGKFLPTGQGESFLSKRHNIVVIVDEAHRSQYDFIDGFAQRVRSALPNASFLGVTATPIELEDRNTRAVFGEYISQYDMIQSKNDEFTVGINIEPRYLKLSLDEKKILQLDTEVDDVLEGEEESEQLKQKTNWAKLEALFYTDKVIKQLADDILTHFEKRLKIPGKGMIVCMSRRICVALYNEIIKTKQDWHSDEDKSGEIKIVMTGSASDPIEYRIHVRNKSKREKIKKRFIDKNDPLKLVIVASMWLAGFDAPVLHTMYNCKPMHHHNLVQAVCRVNRVNPGKEGGLIVDYANISSSLKKALAYYTKSSREVIGIPIEESVEIMERKFQLVKDLFVDFDYSKFFTGKPSEKLEVIPNAMEHILNLDDGKNLFLDGYQQLKKAFSLCCAHQKAEALKKDLSFFQTIRSSFVKYTVTKGQSSDELDNAMARIVSSVIVTHGVSDLFAAAGIKTPDISIFSDEFLKEISEIKQKNLVIELLNKLLNHEIKSVSRSNITVFQSFATELQNTMTRYENQSVSAAVVLAELVKLQKKIKSTNERSKKLKLSDEEWAFYEALDVNDTEVKILGNENLRRIAMELVKEIHTNVQIDWPIRDAPKAKIQLLVKRILRKYGYPLAKQDTTTSTIMEQAVHFT